MAPPWCASFLSGEYVSIWNQAGDLHAFQVRLGPICFGVRECRRSTIARRPDAIREMIKSKFLSMCLRAMELVPQMVHMRTPGRGLLRAAMAVVFGFMSLVHGPVMTFAKASPASAHHESHHALITITLRLRRSHNPQNRIHRRSAMPSAASSRLMPWHSDRLPRSSIRSARCRLLPRTRCTPRTSSPRFLLHVSTSDLPNKLS